jgi:hypothetical protein
MTREEWQERCEEIKTMRLDMGARALARMEEEDDLPLPNIYRVAHVMQEYCIEEGYADEMKEMGLTWRPSVKYWRTHMGELADYMREEYQWYFGFKRFPQKLTGHWKFMEPEEWDYTLRRDHKDIGKRIDTHNDKLEDSVKEYTVEIPHLTDAPLLT